MEFLRQNGMISYLGVVEKTQEDKRSTTTANRPSRHVLESGEPWRAPPDDGSHAETPCQEQAKRATSGIRVPRVKKWKTINTANMFQALCGDDEDSQDSSGESTPPIPPSAHLPKRPNKTNNGKKASSISKTADAAVSHKSAEIAAASNFSTISKTADAAVSRKPAEIAAAFNKVVSTAKPAYAANIGKPADAAVSCSPACRCSMSNRKSAKDITQTRIARPVDRGGIPRGTVLRPTDGGTEPSLQHPAVGGRGPALQDAQQTETKKIPTADMLKMFGQLRSQALSPVSANEGWERIRSIMDSGASVTVASPECAAAYEVTEGAAAKAGTMYEIADGTSIPNLGEKTIAVINCNGTATSKTQQVAAVSNHLTSVRQEMKGNKMVVFDDEGCYTFNKLSSEVVPIEDNGMNFIMEEWVVPPNELSDVLKAIHDPSFHWQA